MAALPTRSRRSRFGWPPGANAIFYGDRLLTTSNPRAEEDRALFARLGLKAGG